MEPPTLLPHYVKTQIHFRETGRKFSLHRSSENDAMTFHLESSSRLTNDFHAHHLIRYFLSPRRKAGQRILLLFQRGGIWGSDVGLCQGRLASVWQSGIQIQVIWLLSSGSSFLGFGGVWLGWRWRQHGMTLPKPAFLLSAQPFYPTLRSHGSGTDISLTDIMNFPSVHV